MDEAEILVDFQNLLSLVDLSYKTHMEDINPSDHGFMPLAFQIENQERYGRSFRYLSNIYTGKLN